VKIDLLGDEYSIEFVQMQILKGLMNESDIASYFHLLGERDEALEMCISEALEALRWKAGENDDWLE